MTTETKRLYLSRIQLRYKKSSKKDKSKILDEFCQVCGYSRIYAIKLLNHCHKEAGKKRGRSPKYTYSDTFHLLRLWKSMRMMCSKRMKAALPLWIRYYEHPEFDDAIKARLLEMSPSTIDRLLKPYKQSWKKGKSLTKQATFVKSQIPLELLNGSVRAPGYIEADTVAHCGSSMAGMFVFTLTMTDLYTGWTENRACWGKTTQNILQRIREVRGCLPFDMRKFASDNGSEFLSRDVARYFREHSDGLVKFFRRRPYKKNDNAHVEQKNDTHVRQIFGYSRLDNPDFVGSMNDIYANYWNPFNNYFCPVMKLKKKIRIGGRIRKIYDKPKTPYQRLLDSENITAEQRRNLELTMEGLNPIIMQETLDKKLKYFHSRLTKDQILGGIMDFKESA